MRPVLVRQMIGLRREHMLGTGYEIRPEPLRLVHILCPSASRGWEGHSRLLAMKCLPRLIAAGFRLSACVWEAANLMKPLFVLRFQVSVKLRLHAK